MDKSSIAKQKQERIKLVSIPVLAIIFLLVIYFQFFSSSPEVMLETATQISPTNPPQSHPIASNVPVESSNLPTPQLASSTYSEMEPQSWKITTLLEISEHDPFQVATNLQPAFPEEEIDDEETIEAAAIEERKSDRQNQLEKAVGTQTATILITSDKGSSAVIGSKIFREGAAWEEGIMIKKIELNGVTVTLPQTTDSATKEQN